MYHVYVGIKVPETRIFDWCKTSFDIPDSGWLVYHVYNTFWFMITGIKLTLFTVLEWNTVVHYNRWSFPIQIKQ